MEISTGRQEKMAIYKSFPVYGITAEAMSAGRDNLTVVREMLEAGIRCVQYREKTKSGLARYEECLQLRQLTKSHVSKAVERLTALGLVLQQRDEMNRRRIHLKLAEAAEPILRDGREAQKRFVEVLTRGLNDEDKAAAARILTVMMENAAAVAAEE